MDTKKQKIITMLFERIDKLDKRCGNCNGASSMLLECSQAILCIAQAIKCIDSIKD